jgi:hypothetical protein
MKERYTIRNWAFTALVIAAVGLVIFFTIRGSVLLRDAAMSMSAPLNTDPTYAFLTRDALIARLTDAERELSHTRWQGALIEIIGEENHALREAAKAIPATSGVTARVLVRPPRTPYDSLVLDAGAESGVNQGDLVVAGGIALGRIRSAGETSSVAELFSNPSSSHDALVGEPPVVAIARGLGGGSFELTVPQEVAVAAGDIVRLPGARSLILGIIARVSAEPTDVSKTVRFAAPVSFAALDFVEIIPSMP